MGSGFSRLKVISEGLLRQDFIRFCLVGGVGFLINLVVLKVAHDVLGWHIILATLFGAELAYFSNFLFHNFWTYKNNPRVVKSLRRLLVQFHLSAWSGMLLNTVIVFVAVTAFHLDSAIGLIIASSVVLFWNYFWTRFYIWRKEQGSDGPLPKVATEPGAS